MFGSCIGCRWKWEVEGLTFIWKFSFDTSTFAIVCCSVNLKGVDKVWKKCWYCFWWDIKFRRILLMRLVLDNIEVKFVKKLLMKLTKRSKKMWRLHSKKIVKIADRIHVIFSNQTNNENWNSLREMLWFGWLFSKYTFLERLVAKKTLISYMITIVLYT